MEFLKLQSKKSKEYLLKIFDHSTNILFDEEGLDLDKFTDSVKGLK